MVDQTLKKHRNYCWDSNFIRLTLVALIIILQIHIVHTDDTSNF